MISRSWKKVTKLFSVDSNKKNMANVKKIFSIDPKGINKVTTADLISRLDLSLTYCGQETDQPVESLKALKPFIKYYQFFGSLPISISPGNTGLWLNKNRNRLWIFTTISLCIQAIMSTKAIKELIQAVTGKEQVKTNSGRVEAATSVLYFVHTMSMTLIMLTRLKLLPGFIEACKKVESLCKKYQPTKDNLVKHCWIAFGVFASSQLVANVLYYYALVERNNVTSASTFSSLYEVDEDGNHDTTGLWGVAFAFFEFYCDCGWLFGDLLIALMSIILARFFIRLNKGISESSARSVAEVEELRKDHRTIKDLVEHCNQIFSPIILVNFMGNTTYLLSRLYTALSVDLMESNIIVRMESIYAFAYQILKILIPTWLAALLNETALESVDTVHDWPSLIQLPETRNRMMVITRFVSQLINDPVGLSGCGYFTITKNFMVTLISGIMTYEVIILQFQQSGL